LQNTFYPGKKTMTQSKNALVAQALGVEIHKPTKAIPWPKQGMWNLDNGIIKMCEESYMDGWKYGEHFTPTTNLQQAVDHIDAVIEAKGYYVSTAGEETYLMYEDDTVFDYTGQGNTRAEKLADGRCEVFLKVMAPSE